MSTSLSPMMTEQKNTTSVGLYILTRLEQLGALSIQGVPGDYNMGFLDLIEDHHTLRWVGNCNELNAAYSSDGYARTPSIQNSRSKRRVGAVVTTFGVGELSALNGIAGSFSERLPVVHIVGVPSTSAQVSFTMLKHIWIPIHVVHSEQACITSPYVRRRTL